MIKLSFLNLFRRKSRTILSLLGIVIGVAAIMGLVSVVDGIQDDFTDAISNLQAVMVIEKDTVDQTLSKIDKSYESDLERISFVRVVVPEIWVIPSTVEGNPNSFDFEAVSVYGIDTAKLTKLRTIPYSVNLKEGKWLDSSDSGKIVLGEALADRYNKFVGSKLKINEESYYIKGIYESSTDLLESLAVMDIEDARDLSSFPSEKVSSFYLELDDLSKDKQVVREINFRFDEIEALSTSDFSETLGGIFESLRLLVFVVAGISAIVAGIGIINTILMSVLERRKEIGALKAVGWTDWNVMKMILLESTFLGIIGGLLGIGAGYLLSYSVETFFGLSSLITPILVAEVFLFAFLLGIFAGVYPAYRASKLDPIEALRG